MKKLIIYLLGIFILSFCSPVVKNAEKKFGFFRVKKISSNSVLVQFKPRKSNTTTHYFNLSLQESSKNTQTERAEKPTINEKNSAITVTFREVNQTLEALFYKQAFIENQYHNPFNQETPITNINGESLGATLQGFSYLIMIHSGKGVIPLKGKSNIEYSEKNGYQWILHFDTKETPKTWRLMIGNIRVSLANPGLYNIYLSSVFTI